MSLQNLYKDINQNIENFFDNFIDKISETYKINKKDLEKLLSEEEKTSLQKTKTISKVKSSTMIDTEDFSIQRLVKCSKAELTALCKKKGVKCSGTKDELIARLSEQEVPEEFKSKRTKKSPSEKKKDSSLSKKEEKIPVLNKLKQSFDIIQLRENKFGNLVHPATDLVFDKIDRIVIGKQQDNSEISELTEEDIETCKRYKFHFRVPDNLDTNGGNEDVKIDELEEDKKDLENIENLVKKTKDQEDEDLEDETETEEDESDEELN